MGQLGSKRLGVAGGRGASADTRPEDMPALPAERAFVVQFRAAGVAGRVEHVLSGNSARFSSPEELFEFMDQVLRALAADAMSANRGGC